MDSFNAFRRDRIATKFSMHNILTPAIRVFNTLLAVNPPTEFLGTVSARMPIMY